MHISQIYEIGAAEHERYNSFYVLRGVVHSTEHALSSQESDLLNILLICLYVNLTFEHYDRWFLEAQPHYTQVCLPVCLSACLSACPFQLASGEVSQVFQVGF